MRFILFINPGKVIARRGAAPPLDHGCVRRQIKMGCAQQVIEDACGTPGHQAQPPFGAAWDKLGRVLAQEEELNADAGGYGARRRLFTDAEAGENTPQQIVGGEFTGDFAQRLLRQAQFFGQQLPRVSAH